MDIQVEQKDGEFERQEDEFHDWIAADGSTSYPAEPGRYHLYVSLACPWAHRTVIVRHLKGLEDVVGMTVLDPVRDERGWRFGEGGELPRDPIEGFEFLSQAYKATNPAFEGRVTVPVLWDRETRRIVNSSEDDIALMLGTAFGAHAGRDVDLFPAALRPEMEVVNALMYDSVNDGVYRAGFAGTQEVHEEWVRALFDTLDQLEDRLARGRYLLGDRMTESDWRLFCTLVRFDTVYYVHFKCNVRRIADYPNLWGYVRDLYQHDGIAETVNMDHIKRHYYMTHPDINPTQIVPIGPELDLEAPHGRGD